MRKRFGNCALCGKECELTFEHIPPRAAFNSAPVRPVSGLELFKNDSAGGKDRLPWEIDGLPYENQQKGSWISGKKMSVMQQPGLPVWQKQKTFDRRIEKKDLWYHMGRTAAKRRSC